MPHPSALDPRRATLLALIVALAPAMGCPSAADDDDSVADDDDSVADDDDSVADDDDSVADDDDSVGDDDDSVGDDDDSVADDDDSAPVDADGDGFLSDVDCADDDPSIHPEAIEVCGNSLDDDCDGRVDREDSGDRYATFNNNDAYYDPSEFLGLPGPIPSTIEFWIRVPSAATWSSTVLSMLSQSGSTTNLLLTADGDIQFSAFSTAFQAITTTATSIPRDTWTHVAFVDTRAGQLRVTSYVNGAQDSIASYQPDFGQVLAGDFYSLGSQGELVGALFDLDDVRVWNAPRTPSELIAAACRPLTDAERLDLQFEQDFEDGFAPVVGTGSTLTFLDLGVGATTEEHPWAP